MNDEGPLHRMSAARDRLVAYVDGRVAAFVESGDESEIFSDDALDAATTLALLTVMGFLATDEVHTPPLRVLAWFHFMRALHARRDGNDLEDYDLAQAIVYFRQLFPFTPDAVPEPLNSQFAADAVEPAGALDLACHVSDVLIGAYRRTGDAARLDSAVQLFEVAADVVPAGHPILPDMLFGYAKVLLTRGEVSKRDTTDLDTAIASFRSASEALPVGDPRRPRFLAGLGMAQRERYERTSEVDYLHASARTLIAVVNEVTEDDPDYPFYLSALGNTISQGSGRSFDLAVAVDHHREVLRTFDNDAPQRSYALSNLAGALRAWFEQTGEQATIDEAVDVAAEAVQTIDPANPDLAGHLANLSGMLRLRHEAFGGSADLESAIAAARRALAIVPTTHPNRCLHVSTLAKALDMRYQETADPAHLRDAAAAFQEAARLGTGAPATRLRAAEAWGRLAATAGDVNGAADGYEQAVLLLPLAAWHGLDEENREEHLAKWSGIACDAAAWAVTAGRPERAVELLESGRALIWSQTLRLRTELTWLREIDPDLFRRLEEARLELAAVAQEFNEVQRSVREIFGPLANSDQFELRAAPQNGLERRARAAHAWDAAVGELSRIEGYADHFAPAPFATLRRAADNGPVVVVNVSRWHCHALVISEGAVRVVDLPGLTYESASERHGAYLTLQHRITSRDLSPVERADDRHALFEVLEWLWDNVVRPVRTHLDVSGRVTRMWWCPCGPLAAMPLHAAGRYPREEFDQTAVDNFETDGVVASYTVTLTALLRARSLNAQASPRMLVVGMPATPGQSPLPAVTAEVQGLDRHAGPYLETITHLIGPNAERTAVRSALADHSWVHLACHASQDPARPSLSCFLLHDGPLTVTDLVLLDLRPAEFAFLSACQTAAGSHRLPDEQLHLAAAMQLLGFRHVVATLWTTADSVAAEISNMVYEALPAGQTTGAGHAAEALHAAVAAVRRRHPSEPSLWAQYIHIGP